MYRRRYVQLALSMLTKLAASPEPLRLRTARYKSGQTNRCPIPMSGSRADYAGVSNFVGDLLTNYRPHAFGFYHPNRLN